MWAKIPSGLCEWYGPAPTPAPEGARTTIGTGMPKR